jgi:hypothetical protein
MDFIFNVSEYVTYLYYSFLEWLNKLGETFENIHE